MYRLCGWLMALALTMAALPACAENRFAMVIGINNYQNVTKLMKAVPDAQAMTTQLKSLGFDTSSLLNPTRREIYQALSVLTGKLQPGDTVLLHYSGHGIQIDGDNFLLPADIPSTDSGDREFMKSEAISLAALVDRFRQSGVRVQILIIDACRDNPFAGGGTRSVGAARGLAPPAATPKGTFILFSAGQGQSALDALNSSDQEPTSPYTRLLLKKMTVPGKSLTDLARELRDEVEAAANAVSHDQRPAYYDELSGAPFYFVAPRGVVALPAPPPVTAPAIANDLTAELAFWDYIKGANNAELFDVYLTKYGDGGQFAAIARIESARLKKLAGAVAIAPVPPAKGEVASADPGLSPPSLPAFNCAVAQTRVETAICGNASLAERDRAMNDLFRQMVASANPAAAGTLRDTQRSWRLMRDNCNTAAAGPGLVACVARAYDLRLTQLRRMAGSSSASEAALASTTPSFDCTAARTPVERQVCAEPTLAARDRQLATLFGTTLAGLAASRRDNVIADQGLWLRQRDLCSNLPATISKCIADAYDRRLAALRAGP